MHNILSDVRSALRQWTKEPGMTLVAVLTLALGIGANTAIFSYVDATWLRPLPVSGASRLVRIYTSDRTSRGEVVRGESSFADYEDMRAQASAFDGMAAYEHRGALLYQGSDVTHVNVDVVSPNFFDFVGTAADVGRTFREGDASAGVPLVVISYRLWQERFGGDEQIAGKQVRLTNAVVTIAGVMPRTFRGVELDAAPSVWVPSWTWSAMVGGAQEFVMRGSRRQTVLARLREGTTLEQAQSELKTIEGRLAAEYPATNSGRKFTVLPERATRSDSERELGWLLFGIAAMVLLIACANVANLQLARAEARRRDMAVRAALGASQGQLVRLALVDTVAMACVGWLGALAVGAVTVKALTRLFAAGAAEGPFDFRVDARVLIASAAVTAVAAVLFGVVPALRAARREPAEALRPSLPSAAGGMALRDTLVVAQMALSLVLLMAAGLLIRTFEAITTVDPGFNAKKPLLMVSIVPGLAHYDGPRLQQLYSQMEDRLAAVPGVERVALAVRFPFSPNGGGARVGILTAGIEPPQGRKGVPVNFDTVGAGYFATVGTAVLRGREFAEQDSEGAPSVCVVNRAFTQRFFAGGDPLGQVVRIPEGMDGTRPECAVVGVVENAKWNSAVEEPRPLLYVPLAQHLVSEMTVLVAAKGDPAAVAGGVRAELGRVAPDVPVLGVLTLREHMELATIRQRNTALLASGFGLLGLLMGVAGVYGVLTYFVSRRKHEMGVRMALGAQRRHVIAVVLRHGLGLVAVGAVIGVGASFAGGRLLSGLLWGVQPQDPVTIASVVAVLVSAATLAMYLPARRAARVDPMVTLRAE